MKWTINLVESNARIEIQDEESFRVALVTGPNRKANAETIVRSVNRLKKLEPHYASLTHVAEISLLRKLLGRTTAALEDCIECLERDKPPKGGDIEQTIDQARGVLQKVNHEA